MSVKVSSWVWHGDETSELAGNEMILMLALADVADDNGRCRYLADEDDLSYVGLASKARVDRRTIERLIPKLRSKGLLAMERGSKSRSNEFTILVPWMRRATDNLSGDASDAPTTASDSPTTATGFTDTSGDDTSLIRIDVRDVSTSDVASDTDDAEIRRLCDLLAAAVRSNGHRVETVGVRWWQACERLTRIDGYTSEQIEWMIRWATSDEFWAANIRSMPKLREKFSTLKAQAMRQAQRRQQSSPTERAASVVEMGRRLGEAGVA